MAAVSDNHEQDERARATRIDALAFAARLGGGHFLEELYEGAHRLAQDVAHMGRPAVLTVKLRFDRPKGSLEPIIVVKDEISLVPPKADPMGTFVFVSDVGFHTSDPRQAELPVRLVPDIEKTVRGAPASGATVVRE
jgi:hypothetical protein